MNTPTEVDLSLWKNVVETHRAFLAASQSLFSDGVDRVALFRDALKTGRDKFTVCYFLPHLKTCELQELFDDLVEWSSTGHGLVDVFHDAILSLPRDWVLPRIEAAAEPFLQAGTDDEYRRFLELYRKLDAKLAYHLACRAVAHDDSEIREAGEESFRLVVSAYMVAADDSTSATAAKQNDIPSPKLRIEGRAG